MPNFKLDNQNMTIQDATYGISKTGMEQYINSLNASLIGDTKKILEQVEGIQSAVDAGWNGAAKASFLKSLQESIIKVEQDLDKEEVSLRRRLDELQASYIYQETHIAKAIDEQR